MLPSRAVQPLPIDPHLPALCAALRAASNLVLVAEPGAGKTTRVPRALLDAGFAADGEIVVLEPDRVARFLDCQAMHVAGRPYDVTIEHADKPDDRPLERRVAGALRRLLASGLDGDVLVFLPGAAEIRRTRAAIDEIARAASL